MIRRIRLDDGVYIHEDDLRERPCAGIALAERLRDWHAERVAALMAWPFERRDEAWLVQLGSHQRDAHDFTTVLDRARGLSTPNDAFAQQRAAEGR